jgi:hypothetical protein
MYYLFVSRKEGVLFDALQDVVELENHILKTKVCPQSQRSLCPHMRSLIFRVLVKQKLVG